jgi:Asp-tRNA(Asn)/Glu-tRNA(Gln) amidotransferase A subunit family amidase
MSGFDKEAFWTEIAKKVRDERDSLRAKVRPELEKLVSIVSNAKREQILSLTATQLAFEISVGHLLSKDAVILYSWRALQCGELLNSNATELFLTAVNQSRDEDTRRTAMRKNLGLKDGDFLPGCRLLEGVPISIKDAYILGGSISTCGVAAKSEHVYATDGLLIKLLKDQGAIIYVRTNIPQSLMLPETDCYLWGECHNAYNWERSPGGSSGGEGVLISTYSSVLGIGTDIGIFLGFFIVTIY